MQGSLPHWHAWVCWLLHRCTCIYIIKDWTCMQQTCRQVRLYTGAHTYAGHEGWGATCFLFHLFVWTTCWQPFRSWWSWYWTPVSNKRKHQLLCLSVIYWLYHIKPVATSSPDWTQVLNNSSELFVHVGYCGCVVIPSHIQRPSSIYTVVFYNIPWMCIDDLPCFWSTLTMWGHGAWDSHQVTEHQVTEHRANNTHQYTPPIYTTNIHRIHNT